MTLSSRRSQCADRPWGSIELCGPVSAVGPARGSQRKACSARTSPFVWVGNASPIGQGECPFLLPCERLPELDELWHGDSLIQAPARSVRTETYPVRISAGLRRGSDV